MDFKELQELIRILEESSLTEIEVEEEGRRIRLQKPGPPAVLQPVAMVPVVAPSAPVVADPSAAETEEVDEACSLPTIDAPMVGTFYAASAPGEEPFVQAGDTVEENQTVCIVEAMKLMNEIATKFAGIIEKVLVENGQPVEFGQPLFAIRAVE
ncbi:MAG: acetyl-CoA carboxylase biotin carboxyl carrier protein [Candidatus Hydrogenedentes bacterium]|nr:acetyl-CoA carboxylase biotin carboxyl carrier protein [Candidatus Hydrogenedentota bacterium]